MIETIGFILTGLGLAASIVYYANILNNANKTRELQLESQKHAAETRQIQLLLDFHRGKIEKGNQNWFEIMALEWENYDDFLSKYGYGNKPDIYYKRLEMWNSLNISGLLVRDGLIDLETYIQYVGDAPILVWAKFKEILIEQRRIFDNPDHFIGLEYLAKEIELYRKSKGLSPKIMIYADGKITPNV